MCVIRVNFFEKKNVFRAEEGREGRRGFRGRPVYPVRLEWMHYHVHVIF